MNVDDCGKIPFNSNSTPSHVCFRTAKDAHLKKGNLPTPAAEIATESLIEFLSTERTTRFPRQRPSQQIGLQNHIKGN